MRPASFSTLVRPASPAYTRPLNRVALHGRATGTIRFFAVGGALRGRFAVGQSPCCPVQAFEAEYGGTGGRLERCGALGRTGNRLKAVCPRKRLPVRSCEGLRTHPSEWDMHGTLRVVRLRPEPGPSSPTRLPSSARRCSRYRGKRDRRSVRHTGRKYRGLGSGSKRIGGGHGFSSFLFYLSRENGGPGVRRTVRPEFLLSVGGLVPSARDGRTGSAGVREAGNFTGRETTGKDVPVFVMPRFPSGRTARWKILTVSWPAGVDPAARRRL